MQITLNTVTQIHHKTWTQQITFPFRSNKYILYTHTQIHSNTLNK